MLDMRFIPTTAVVVEKLKQQAKKSKSKLKITHAEALDRVARGAGYNNWGHVTWCVKQTAHMADGPTLQKECNVLIEAALAGQERIVLTGPEILEERSLILFSTADGDAWLLDPESEMAMCLAWHGQRHPHKIIDRGSQYHVDWHGSFRLHGDSFVCDTTLPDIGRRSIFGYPIDKLRDAMNSVEPFDAKIRNIFIETEELTDGLIDRLVSGGWKREDLEHARKAGAEYSPARHSLVFPMNDGND
jgi:hypothetical protein